jgi:hypothetical protein
VCGPVLLECRVKGVYSFGVRVAGCRGLGV